MMRTTKLTASLRGPSGRTRAGVLLTSLAVVAVTGVSFSGCIAERCDPGYYRVRGACYPEETEPVPSGDSGIPDDGAVGPTCPGAEGFGQSCTADAECTCGTRCIPVLDICTRLNCMEPGGAGCPEGWTCTDISAQSTDPTVTSICLEG